jgi:uncharacterized protein (DUF1786 family)
VRFLIMDIGAGTEDILYYDSDSGRLYKAVSESPVLSLAEKAERLPGKLLITGKEMGGGAISQVLKKRAKTEGVVMSVSSAPTIHHDVERVRSFGIEVIPDEEAEDLKRDKGYSHLAIGDLEMEKIHHVVQGMGVPFSFDVVGICAQDHGMPPPGVSHLNYRHTIFTEQLERNPFPHIMLFRDDEVPHTLGRLSSLAGTAKDLHPKEVYVMDSGMAAILGASLDPVAEEKERILTLDIATSHTVGATMKGGELAGFFEYHTKDITLERLESLLMDLAEGRLAHKRILEEGGHGAYIREAIGFQALEVMVATGPKRALLKNTRYPLILGAPLGDNMMTGTAGVLEAIRRRLGLNPIPQI